MYEAAICERGHVISSAGLVDTRHCPTCGARIVTRCPHCLAMIPGREFRRGVIGARPTYERPAFCVECGGAYPWASRQERLWELENQLNADPLLSAADRLTIHEQMDELRAADLTEAQQTERWKRLEAIAPQALKRSANLVEAVGTAWILKRLGVG